MARAVDDGHQRQHHWHFHQHVKWIINTGGQDHRWLGNGYFKAQGIETIAHASAQADMIARAPEHLAGLISVGAPALKGAV